MLAFLGADGGEGRKERSKKKTNQSIGEYCKGRDIEECMRYFGQGLAGVCATCPQ